VEPAVIGTNAGRLIFRDDPDYWRIPTPFSRGPSESMPRKCLPDHRLFSRGPMTSPGGSSLPSILILQIDGPPAVINSIVNSIRNGN